MQRVWDVEKKNRLDDVVGGFKFLIVPPPTKTIRLESCGHKSSLHSLHMKSVCIAYDIYTHIK